jgi:hypothetical protein
MSAQSISVAVKHFPHVVCCKIKVVLSDLLQKQWVWKQLKRSCHNPQFYIIQQMYQGSYIECLPKDKEKTATGVLSL